MKKKNFIKKNKSTIIFLAVIVVVLALVVVLSSVLKKEYLEEITYDEYLEKVESGKEFSVFFGTKDSDSYNSVLSIVKENGINSYYVDTKDLTNDVRKKLLDNESLYAVYEDSKEVYSYNDKFTSYSFLNDMMSNDMIERKYIEVTISEYLDIIKQEGYHFMFVGSSQCSYCTMFKESINQALKNYDFNVYYVDLANESITESDRNKLYASDKYFTEEQWGTPLNFLYKDGKRINVLNGYVEVGELVDFLKDNKVIK